MCEFGHKMFKKKLCNFVVTISLHAFGDEIYSVIIIVEVGTMNYEIHIYICLYIFW